mgnify:CR=1 FL=1
MIKEMKNFYPTPKELIEKMVGKIEKYRDLEILEPSAGKGDIIEFLENIKKSCFRKLHIKNIDCIEIDNNLRAILKDKKFNLIDKDFLNFKTYKNYDLIIMNPPFDMGVHHLLKAISLIEKNGGQIICLLNAETLKNTCSNFRIDLMNKLEDYKAEIEFIQNAFSNAERETNVEIALININIPKKIKSNLFKNIKESQTRKIEELKADKITSIDFLQSLIERYNFEVEYGIKILQDVEFFNNFVKESENQLKISNSYNSYQDLEINEFVEKIRYKYWKILFDNENLYKLFTSELRQKFYSNLNNMKKFEFNMENIKEVILILSNNMKSSLEEDILKLFDEFSHKYHYYDETSKNIHYYNGWKTNKAHMINKKVIVPLNNYYRFELDYYSEQIIDIYKIFMYLDTNNSERKTIKEIKDILLQADRELKTRNVNLGYFTVSIFKKGTMHIVFNDEKLLLKFNIFGSQMKNWLPPAYGKKKYEDLDIEEKNVIDSFQGEENYKEVFNNNDNYLFHRDNIQLISI